MVTIRTVITLTAQLIMGLASITVADTGLIIGGTAAGFIIGTAADARFLSIFAGAVLSRAASEAIRAELPTILYLAYTVFIGRRMTVSARDTSDQV